LAEYDSVIPAGGSGTLTANMKTSPVQNGRISKSISVETDAPGARSLRLRFSAQVEAPILVKPRLRFIITAVEGEAASRRILLHRTDGKALEVKGLETGNAALVAKSTAVTKKTREGGLEAEPGDIWLDLATNPSERLANSNGSVRLSTNHPDLPTLDVPYTVRVRPLIELRPAAVRLRFSQGSGGRRRSTVSLTGNSGRKFRITGAEVSHPELFSATINSQGSASRHTMWVGLVDDLTADSVSGPIQGFVRIRTDDPARPLIELPVEVTVVKSAGRRTMHGKPVPQKTPQPTTGGAG